MNLFPLLGLAGVAVIAMGLLGWELETRSKKALRFLGLIVCAFALGGIVGASTVARSGQSALPLLKDITVGATPLDSFVSCDNSTHQIIWNVVFNSTSHTCAGGSWEAAVQFNVQSNEAVAGEVSVSLLSVSSIGGYSILNRTTNGTFEARWQLGDDLAWESRNLMVVAGGHVAVILHLLLDPTAVALMSPLEHVCLTVAVGGQTFDIEVVLAAVTH